MNNKKSSENKDVFDIKEKLATGSFGSTIFKAYNPVLGQVAIAKKYPAAITNDYEGFMTILDDVRECRSPQIVGLYGYYKAVKYFWVVMEYCHGYSIFNLMTQLNRPLKESQIRTVLSHVLRGLEALHTHNIVHTRVKASNILLTTYGVCKLAEPGPPITMSEIGVNVDGLIGNAYWSAPEVLLEKGYRTASDIWSVGITAIEMAERQPPYAETHPSRVMVAIPARSPPEFLNPDSWSKSIKVFLSNCLQKNPDLRMSASQLLSQKIMRKADYKGMQTIVQKFIKLHQQNSRFYAEPPTVAATPPNKQSKEKRSDVPVDEENWTASGTLVWNPSTSAPVPSSSHQSPHAATGNSAHHTPTHTSNPPPHRQMSNPSPHQPPSNISSAASTGNLPHQQQNVDSTPRRSSSMSKAAPSQNSSSRSELTSAKRAASQPIPTKPAPPPAQQGSGFTADTDTMKRGNFGGAKHKYIEPNDTPVNKPHSDVPSNSKPPSDKMAASKVPNSHARRKPPSPDTAYPDQTVKVKEAANYTPQYMDFYRDEEPPLMVGDDQLQDTTPHSQSSIVRRNSIDQRGIERNRAREELQKNLDGVDMEYCSELENIRMSCLMFHEALLDCIASHKDATNSTLSGVSSKLSFYSKLNKLELSLMLKFVNMRHEEVLKTAKEHFDLEHQFLMSALRNTTDSDDEVRYNLSISENNELQAETLAKINRQFQCQSEEIMRALERIDYAAAIAED